MTKPPTMFFEPLGREVPIQGAESVLEVALRGGVALEHSCGGMGTCTTCRVIIESELHNASPRTVLEAEMAESRGFRPDERLSCQLEPHPGLVVRIPKNRL
jgi:ferredoxin, 2Fe-2S